MSKLNVILFVGGGGIFGLFVGHQLIGLARSFEHSAFLSSALQFIGWTIRATGVLILLSLLIVTSERWPDGAGRGLAIRGFSQKSLSSR